MGVPPLGGQRGEVADFGGIDGVRCVIAALHGDRERAKGVVYSRRQRTECSCCGHGEGVVGGMTPAYRYRSSEVD